ncbi:MAG: alpha/beta hydrolase [Desulfatirhabdiaceae bacterium]
MERKIHFLSDQLTLAGLISESSLENGVVITHPHPLYGGNMFNPVVEAVQQAYQSAGWTTLRFNFRGVGDSEGKFDNGTGEQTDVASAITCLTDMGIGVVDLVGYSFGAWVNSMINTQHRIHDLIMISPPVAFIRFDAKQPLSRLKRVITGSEDEIAPASMIQDMIPVWNPDAHFHIIDGADHFYTGYLDKLRNIVRNALSTCS